MILNEQQLVQGLKDKNPKVFEYLYDNYTSAIFGVIVGVVRDNEVAEDLLQDVFLKIWNKIEYYDSTKGRIYTWMINMARNSSIDKLRSKGFNNKSKTKSIDDSVSGTSLQNQHSHEMFVDHIGMDGALMALKPTYRTLIEMVYFEGYSQADVAEELNIPLGTVKTRLRKAIFDLREKLSAKNE
jgi:RNA polymerase sigma-70 factor (ECF subfamily)